MEINSHKKGLSIIEIVISAAIIAVTISGIVAAINVFLIVSVKNTNQAQATLILEESVEIFQYLRDSSWDSNFANIPLDSDFFLDWNGTDYSTTTVPVLINGKFTARYQLKSVNRDANDDIVDVGGVLDPNTRLVDVLISWQESSGPESISSEFLIHNVYQN